MPRTEFACNHDRAIMYLIIKAMNARDASRYAQDRGFIVISPVLSFDCPERWAVRVARNDLRAAQWFTDPAVIMPIGGYEWGSLIWYD